MPKNIIIMIYIFQMMLKGVLIGFKLQMAAYNCFYIYINWASRGGRVVTNTYNCFYIYINWASRGGGIVTNTYYCLDK